MVPSALLSGSLSLASGKAIQKELGLRMIPLPSPAYIGADAQYD
jgi:hypothetical protein